MLKLWMDAEVETTFAERLLTKDLAGFLSQHGFRPKTDLLIARSFDNGEAQIRCAVRTDRGRDALWATLIFGVRFEQIECVMVRSKTDMYHPTIICSLDHLHKDRKGLEWDAADSKAATFLYEEVRTCAMPFFDKYSNLDTLLAVLEANQRPFDFSVDAVGGIALIAAIWTTLGRTGQALELLDKEIAAREKDFVWGPRLELKRLRERLASL